MKARSVVVVFLIAFIVMCISPPYAFDKFQFSKTDNAKLLFERSKGPINGNSSISLEITFDGWNALISGIQEVELSLTSPTLVTFFFENFSILNMNIKKIEVYGAKATMEAFYDGKYGVLLLNVTPIERVQRIKIVYTLRYQPLLDIEERDIIEWHMKSTEDYFYLPPEAYMLIPKIDGNVTINVESYPASYTLAGILKLPNNKYKPLLPEKGAFYTDGGRFYVLLGRWNIYKKNIVIDGKNVDVVALTDEGEWVVDELAKILKIYSSQLIPYPYRELIYIRFKGHRSEYEGCGLYGGALGTQFKSVIPHEVAHNWFGMYAELGLLDESLATYTSISMNNLTLDTLDKWEAFCFSSKKRTPIAEMRNIEMSRMTDITANLYYRGGFIFRSLQFVVGNETFFEGLRELLKICHVKDCTKTEETLTLIKEIFENMTNRDLNWFFEEWFYTADYPNFTVSSLKITQNSGYYTLILNITEENSFTMPLEVGIVTLAENITKRILVNGSSSLEVKTKERPIMIILDPNNWIANINGSSYRFNWEKLTFEKTEKKEREINGVKIVIN
ncbi:aminopeptidase [Thermococcus sp. MV5]|uniref:M1 family metallopeptidase n=1 Tax=Thermococcus sp. MV5 TaxID=1638272 RepID=UPI00143AFD32|nr:M1 family metallopeptidase [Thermococcus sp. MV5]NJE26275.1 aminopeptidase [Thermococcus sp. MV5]